MRDPAAPDCDLLVVGAGPAGLATAIFARQAGYSVVVCDPGGDVQDKACGEGLMPAGVAALARLGVALPDDAFVPLAGVRYHDGGVVAAAPLAAGAGGRGLSRQVLSAALSARAQAAGVVRRRARLRDLHGLRVADLSSRSLGEGGEGGEEDSTSALAASLDDGGQLKARYVVGADGLHSTVRRLAGLQPAAAKNVRTKATTARFGLRRHYRRPPWSAYVEVYLGRGCEAYVTPVDAHTINVAILTPTPKQGFAALLAKFPALAAQLAGALACDLVRGAGPFAQAVRPCARGRVALVGDAAGYVDAITGEGVSLALLSAEAWVEAMAQPNPAARYGAALRPLWRHYAFHARLLLALGRWPTPRRWVLRACALAPWAMAWWVRRAAALPAPAAKVARR